MRAVPLHARIRDDVEAAILSGALPVGARIPVEHELMARYRCSRMTVSKALSTLAAAGLIDRRKGAGSFVARPRVHAMVLAVPDLAAELADRGQEHSYTLCTRTIRAARTGDADEGLLAGGGMLLALRGVHRADGVPLAIEDRLISLAAVPEAEAVDFAHVSPGTWLLRHIPWTEAENRIAAESADRGEAALLAVPAGAACLVVQRRTWRGTERITSVRQLFVGAAYDLVARFGPLRNGTENAGS